MRVVLLGAGASAATLGNDRAPISAKFGMTLNAQNPQWHERYPFLRSAILYLQAQSGINENWPLDRVWNGIDENYKLALVIGNEDFQWPALPPDGKRLHAHYAHRSWKSFWLLAGWELKRALAEIYGRGLQCLLRKPELHHTWLAGQLRELRGDDALASTNYDLLAESIVRGRWPAASNCRTDREFRLRTAEHGPLVLKLHGSLDWPFRTNRITTCSRVDRTVDGASITDDDIDLDENFWETRPLVVAPVRYKDEIVFPRAQPAELVEVLNFQWERFIDAVSRAEELQVLGYRFPPEDSYGNRMLQEAMRRRPAGAQLQVRLHLPNEPPECECRRVQARLEQDIFRAGFAQVQCVGAIPLGNVCR